MRRLSYFLFVLAVLISAALSHPTRVLAQEGPASAYGWGDWEAEIKPDTAEFAARNDNWVFIYNVWQWGISSLSGLGPISPIQGRRAVEQNAAEIHRWAPDAIELLVAASIAHQASDFKDRPFGTDALEIVWRELINDNISVGIAQLREQEVVYWAPRLQGVDLLAPEAAIRVMTAKLNQTHRYIIHTYPDASVTDQMMLLALAQNAASYKTVSDTVDFFFGEANRNWNTMLESDHAQNRDWQEQLRLVLVHVNWLVEQNWEIPEGLDLAAWERIAFSGG
ncbi:MAG: hypothetical protein ABTQ73_11440 [Caldilineales bacterium]